MRPGLIPVLTVSCGLSLLLLSPPAPRAFSRLWSFPPSTKLNTSKFQFKHLKHETLHQTRRPLTTALKVNYLYLLSYLVSELFSYKSNWGHCKQGVPHKIPFMVALATSVKGNEKYLPHLCYWNLSLTMFCALRSNITFRYRAWNV